MNYCSHDPACCLMKLSGDNLEFVFAEEGFLSRKKKSYQFPLRSMKYCLDYFDIGMHDLDVLMLDYMDEERFFKTSNNYRLLIGDFIRSRLKIDPDKVKFVKSHHYAHALTAFWPSGLKDAAVLVVDGLGSRQQTHSIFSFDADGSSSLIFEQKGGGIGSLYSLITTQLGFGSGEEGKTMGLAPYGGDIRCKEGDVPDFVGTYFGPTVDYSHFSDRNPSPSLKVYIETPKDLSDVYNDYYTRLAFNIQQEAENCISHLVSESIKLTGKNNICYAGGVALNCVANSRIQSLPDVKEFWIQPASGDSGLPFGLALAGFEKIGFNLGEILSPRIRAQLAHPYSQDQRPLEKIVDEKTTKLLTKHRIKTKKFNSQFIAGAISKKKIIALFSGGIELGPRALGHRSFLADARSAEMKDLMNSKIKHREGYRPFAPMVLKTDFSKYFLSETSEHPYMLQAPICTEYALKAVPAICHVDQTSRVQTVTKENGKAHSILKEYQKITGESVIINTSFNDNNEPIVFTKIDALCAFLNCNADYLILEDVIIDRLDISDLSKFLDEATQLQTDLMDSYFSDAIDELTEISNSTGTNELSDFIQLNDRLAREYREARIEIRLVEFLLSRDKTRTLVTDDYHMEIIKQFSGTNNVKINEVCPNCKIIKDELSDIGRIPANGDLILYNLSGYFHNRFTQDLFDNNKTLLSFYRMNDKKLQKSAFEFAEKQTNLPSAKEQIMQSYEHRRDQNIDDFFRSITQN